MENIQPANNFSKIDTEDPTPNKNRLRGILLIVFLVILLIVCATLSTLFFILPKVDHSKLYPEPKLTTQLNKEINLKTTLLATIPKEYVDQKYDIRGNFLDYGRDVFWYAYSKVSEETPHIVILNGDTNNKTEHYNILSGDLSKPLIYLTQGGESLVVDGIKEKYNVNDKDNMVIGKTGKIIAYLTKSPQNKSQVVVNGMPQKEYSVIAGISISQDEEHVVYTAYEGERISRQEKTFLVVDNKEKILNYNFISKPVFSPDGKRIAYFATSGDNLENSKCFFIVDETENQVECSENFFVNLAYGTSDRLIEFSQNSERVGFIYPAGNDDGYLWVDGKKYLNASEWEFSPNSKYVAYISYDRKAKNAFVAIDGKAGKKYASVNMIGDSGKPIIWSPDSKKLAYSATNGNYEENFIVTATDQGVELEGQVYYEISSIKFSPDSQRVVYLAGTIIGTTLKTDLVDAYSNKVVAKDVNSNVTFSNDSQKVAIIVRASDQKNFRGWSKAQIIINGKMGEAYDEIWTDPKFSLDGKFVGYGALKGNELWWIVDRVQ